MESNYDGTCKGPDKHKWNKGDEVFYDKSTKAICIDGKCFQKLKAGGQASPGNIAPTRTLEQRTEDARQQLELLWPMCLTKACTVLGLEPKPIKASELKNDPEYKDALILAQVFYKGGSMVWAR